MYVVIWRVVYHWGLQSFTLCAKESHGLTRNPISKKDDKLVASGKPDNTVTNPQNIRSPSEFHTAFKFQLVYRNLKTDSYSLYIGITVCNEGKKDSISNEKVQI